MELYLILAVLLCAPPLQAQQLQDPPRYSRTTGRAKYLRPNSTPFPTDNPFTKEKELLGRTLFFDPRLSGSKTIACATCHNPGFAWGDGLPLGIGGYLNKPIRIADLLDAIQATLSESTPHAPSSPLVTRHSLREERRRILVAEDNAVNQRVAVRLLEKQGHSVVVANNGRAAIEALEREPFDLVLMDVQMPEMDGFEATAAIRRKEKVSGHRLQIIAMTAHAMKGDLERCLAAGMDRYVSKPIQIEALKEAIDSALERSQPH